MVITKIQEGLGNQMFQYAVGAVLAKRLKTRLYIDTTWYDEVRAWSREYELDIFNIKNEKMHFIDKIGTILNKPVLHSDSHLYFKYEPAINQWRGNIILEGFWQSYKYFTGNEEFVRSLFKFPVEVSKKNADLAELAANTESISLHVRRGDYVANKEANKMHGLQPVEYYNKALEKIRPKTHAPKVFVFSDDLEWCKNNLGLASGTVFVGNNKGKNSFEDMRLMALCKHNIIANSSFSWWGAWLNTNPDKVVCAPKKRFNDPLLDTSKLTPPSWHLL